MLNDAVAKEHKGRSDTPLNQLLKDQGKGGVSQKDLKISIRG
jgi:hypothetical protein